jgi:hypothetical protein
MNCSLDENGGFGGGCTADGVDLGCGLVQALIGSGAAAQCPNNNCTGIYGIQGDSFMGWIYGPTGTIRMTCQGPMSNPTENCGGVTYPEAWSLGAVGQVDQVGMDIWHTGKPIFGSASDWVTAGTIYTGAGIVTVVAAPAAPAVADAYYAVNDYALELEAESPGTIKATADVIRSLLSPMSTTPPSTVSGFTMRGIMWFWMNKPF